MIHALGDNLIPVMAMGCTFLFLVTWVIMATVDSIYKTKCNASLKERLIERGSSAAEIDQIIRAGTGVEEEPRYVAPTAPVKSHTYPMSG